MLEYLPTSTRATIIIVIELFWSLGGIFEYVMAMWIMPTQGWRLLTFLSALPISIVAVCMYVSRPNGESRRNSNRVVQFVPESPRYFVASGRADKAEDILKTIALTNKRALPDGKLLDVNARVRFDRSVGLRTSFRLGRMRVGETVVPRELQTNVVSARLHVDDRGDELLRHHLDQHIADDAVH